MNFFCFFLRGGGWCPSSCVVIMNTKPNRKVDKARLNFRISPTLHDRLAEYADEHGMKAVSEAAWFLLNAAMIERSEKRLSPPPAKSIIL
jgi:hypothetical protein